jgi:hypothetical protein
MSFTDLRFAVENDENDSQCLVNRVIGKVAGISPNFAQFRLEVAQPLVRILLRIRKPRVRSEHRLLLMRSYLKVELPQNYRIKRRSAAKP